MIDIYCKGSTCIGFLANSGEFIQYTGGALSSDICAIEELFLAADTASLELLGCDVEIEYSDVSNDELYTTNEISHIEITDIGEMTCYGTQNTVLHTRRNNENDDCEMQFENVKELFCLANGSVDFSVSPEKSSFDAAKQIISFNSLPNRSSAILTKNDSNYKLSTNGYVYAASIGGYDLFPSFRNWYYNNLYIAPLTLLSVVISSVAIIFKKRKKK